jgi:predicted DNA-binding transcriptional regulator AlpA
MNAEVRRDPADLISAAEIARLAGVTRAAVSNWRKRYAEFPAPVGGTRNALFARSEVQHWLDQQRKGRDVSDEVLLWQAIRGQYGDDLLRGLADVSELLTGAIAKALSPDVRTLAEGLTAERPPAEIVEGLAERFVDSSGRAGSEHVSSSRLTRAVRHFTGSVSGTVFDPACGIGSLLLAFGGESDVALVGQEISAGAARFAQLRAVVAGPLDTTIGVGDSLRDDRSPELRAELVVCDPPVNTPDWGREDLLLDSRWEFGVPTRAEGELAWLQHCYAHTAPGGRVVVVMPPSVAYRRAGRRIRAELVRRGVLTHLVALPAGMVSSHAQPVHLWMLRRPISPNSAVTAVRMVDLTTYDPDGSLDPAPNHTVDVALIELLDETVDLTPTNHVTAYRTDHLSEFMAIRETLTQQLYDLVRILPALGDGPGAIDGVTVRVADLARAGLVTIADGEAASTSDQLDTDYLHGFLRSALNTGRSTSSSGSFRFDTKGARIPQMGIDEQRRYGTAFRALADFERRFAELTRLADRATTLARDGLTSGALGPGPNLPDPVVTNERTTKSLTCRDT